MLRLMVWRLGRLFHNIGAVLWELSAREDGGAMDKHKLAELPVVLMEEMFGQHPELRPGAGKVKKITLILDPAA